MSFSLHITTWVPSLRLYFGSGECLLLRPLSGEVEEMHEVITRLQAVTNGTEVRRLIKFLSCIASCIIG